MGDFEVDTRVAPLGGGRYRAHLDPDWEIWGPNGGYVAAIALRAAGAEARLRPSSFTCHFLAVGAFDEAVAEVEVVRAGRRSELLRARIVQGERVLVEALLRTAREGPGLEHVRPTMPPAPHWSALPSVDALLPADTPRHAFWQNLEQRFPDPERVAAERTAREPEWIEWYRFRPRATFDDPWVDAGRSLLLLDTLGWPAACGPHPDGAFIAPSLDVTVWFHDAAPRAEWLLAHVRAPLARGGLMGAQGAVYADDGRLLATGGAHMLCAPAPAPAG